MSSFRTQLLRTLALPGVARAMKPLLRSHATVFVIHRLRDLARGIPGNQPEAIRAALAFLRRKRFDIVTLEEIVRRRQAGEPPLRGAVAFTLDDGYAEQGLPIASLFSEFDCPVTVFATTGFLDGKLWMWWDKIEYVLRRTGKRRLAVEMGGSERTLAWEDEAGRVREQWGFVEACKKLEDAEKHGAIARLAEAADVELPEKPPPEYEPMSWQDLRASERMGMQFGPHTVTHPILARLSAESMYQELADSWDRLRAEAAGAVPIFCYPNGQPGDFGDREYAALRELGLAAAVTGLSGYVGLRSSSDSFEAYKLRRFTLSDQLPNVIQCASGFERIKQFLRGVEP